MQKIIVSWTPLILDVGRGTMPGVLAVRRNVRSPKVHRFEPFFFDFFPFFWISRAGLAQKFSPSPKSLMVSDPKSDHCWKWSLAWILSGWGVVDPAQMAVWISSEVSGAPQLFRCCSCRPEMKRDSDACHSDYCFQ